MRFDLDNDRYQDILLGECNKFSEIAICRYQSQNLFLNPEQTQGPASNQMICSLNINENSQTVSPFQEPISKKDAKKLQKNIDNVYEKNICAYISKIVYQKFVQNKYKRKVIKICRSIQIDYQSVIEYYRSLNLKGFGIALLVKLVTPEDQQQFKIKKVFSIFLDWFLREKYILYILQYGKMEQKGKYIQFKNKYLLYVSEAQKKFF